MERVERAAWLALFTAGVTTRWLMRGNNACDCPTVFCWLDDLFHCQVRFICDAHDYYITGEIRPWRSRLNAR